MTDAIAEIFPPGELLRDELEARGWSQTELAEIMGRPVRLINEIIAGKKAITPETAIQLGDSLGTGPELWMNLESRYQLSKVQASDGLVARRASLYARFPVREMIKRGWIAATRNIEELESQFKAFFELKNFDDEVCLSHAAKKTHPDNAVTMLQNAWLFRARRLAAGTVASKFSVQALESALPRLQALLSAPEEARHVASILGDCGVRLVAIEAIPGSKIDGACFWLSNSQPVIALSLRLDRIDNFWFVLRHEIEHVRCGHGQERGYILDQDLDSTAADATIADEERVANEAATEFCVSQAELSGFMARVGPFYAEDRVVLFAQRLRVHPGLVVGQLQRRLRRYDLFRKHQVKVRSCVTSSALTDGWGVVHTS
jgi:HTH-type transcriptional regulator/antitoxin HigA